MSATRCSAGQAVERTVEQFGRIDILVNNAAEQHLQIEIPQDPEAEQLERTFRTNVFGIFYLAKARCRTWRKGRASSTPPRSPPIGGHKTLLDYSSTKGAIVSFTRSLSRRWSKKASASTRSRRGRSGRR